MQPLLIKYKTLYSSVPTSDAELQHLNSIINNGISNFKEQGIFLTPDLIHNVFTTLKRAKMMIMFLIRSLDKWGWTSPRCSYLYYVLVCMVIMQESYGFLQFIYT